MGVYRGFNEYVIEGDVTRLLLTGRKGEPTGEALISTTDLAYLQSLGYRWSRADGPKDRIYVATKLMPQHVTAMIHRVLVGLVATTVDHANGDGLDNRRCNLRPASSRQNNANRRKRKGTSCEFKGVIQVKGSGRYKARIGRVCTTLGTFDSAVLAAHAYDAAAREMFGEFALLNFPDEKAS